MSSLILYKATEEQFGHLGLGVLDTVKEPKVPEDLNGPFTLEFKYPKNGELAKELTNDRIIKTSASPKLRNQRFRILRVTKHSTKLIKVYAEHISGETSGMQLKPEVNYSGTAQQALTTWKNNMVDDHPFTVSSDIDVTGEGTWETEEVENARQALGGVRGSILDIYGGEYRFDNYRIQLLRNRGDDSQIPIMYGKNLIDLEQEEEIRNTYTSIMPFSKYEEEAAEGEEPETITVTLPEFFIDSDYVQNYGRRKILKVDFSNDDIKTEAELRKRAKRYIEDNNVGVPRVNIKVNFLDLAKTLNYKDLAKAEEINLGDRVIVLFSRLGIKKKAKVVSVEWDPVMERYNKIEIGELRASLSDSIDKIVDDKVEGEFGRIHTAINRVQVAANGKNKNFYGPDKPTKGMEKNDHWRKPVGEGETELYRYDGEQWRLIIGAGINEATKERIVAAEKIAADAKEDAEGAVRDLEEGTSFFKHADNIGLASKNEDGTINSIIKISEDGTAYIGGEHIVLDGDTIVEGTFTVTDEIFAENMDITKFTAGTLNAKDVDIINLNAESIAGGDLRLERGIEITNNGIPILTVNSAGEVELNIEKMKINAIDLEEELNKKADAEEVQREIENIELTPGPEGKTAYDIAVENGFEGTEEEWIQSLVGKEGSDGKTAYDIAVEEGFTGSRTEWLNSLKGEKGEDGKDGVRGPRGDDGYPTYTWIAYADTENGGGISTKPGGKEYVGYAAGKTTKKVDISNPGEFEWQLVKGEKGEKGEEGDEGPRGIRGPDGKDGKPNYTWIKYANEEETDGEEEAGEIVEVHDSPIDAEGEPYKFIGLAYNKSTGSQSTNPDDYEWQKSQQYLDKEIEGKTDEEITDAMQEDLDRIDEGKADKEELDELERSLNQFYDDLESNQISAQEAKDGIEDLLNRAALIDTELGELTQNWNFINTYITMGDEGLLVGDESRDTGVLIDPDGIYFRQDGEIIANITDGILKIDRGVFVESLSVGEHKFETISTGNTVVSWVP